MKRFIWLIMLMVVAALLMACGGGTTPQASLQSASAVTPTPPEATESQAEMDPSDYSFTVQYTDIDGGESPAEATVQFKTTGPFSNEDIPIPAGYSQFIPAHPGDEWLFPTSLELVSGEWTVTVPVVTIDLVKE